MQSIFQNRGIGDNMSFWSDCHERNIKCVVNMLESIMWKSDVVQLEFKRKMISTFKALKPQDKVIQYLFSKHNTNCFSQIDYNCSESDDSELSYE